VRRRHADLGADLVALPEPMRSPWRILATRLALAISILIAVALIAYVDRDGYVDGTDPTGRVTLLDALYYSTVSLSTTGYGDISPISDQARLINILVVTPARIAFLVLLIGATVEVLAAQSRQLFRISRWRKQMGKHIVVVGYGSKGRSATETLISNGLDPESIIVVDPAPQAAEDAHADGLAVITGDATRRNILRRAGVETAQQVIIATSRDDSNVLAALTVRQLNPDATIIASVRDQDNAPLLRQSGVDSVITSSDAVGRLLGLSTLSPTLGTVLEDLLTHGAGLEVTERDLLLTEVGKQPQSLPDQVIAVVRDERVFRYFDPSVSLLARGDRLIVVRPAEEKPWAPRPGTHEEARSYESD
jgi:voltage-gated potassium channel